ncbi:phage tail assembly chaperone [Acinetobacter baumannii]
MQIGNHNYEIGRLDAFDQFHVSRKIASIVPTIVPFMTEILKSNIMDLLDKFGDDPDNPDLSVLEDFDLNSFGEAIQPFIDAFAKMPEEDVNYVMKKCLSVVTRDGAKVVVKDTLMFDDLSVEHILPLTIAVVRINLGNFIQGLLTTALSKKQPT